MNRLTYDWFLNRIFISILFFRFNLDSKKVKSWKGKKIWIDRIESKSQKKVQKIILNRLFDPTFRFGSFDSNLDHFTFLESRLNRNIRIEMQIRFHNDSYVNRFIESLWQVPGKVFQKIRVHVHVVFTISKIFLSTNFRTLLGHFSQEKRWF